MKLVEVDPNTGAVMRHIVRPIGAPPMRGPVERGTLIIPVNDFRSRRYANGRLEDWARPPSGHRDPEVLVPSQRPVD